MSTQDRVRRVPVTPSRKAERDPVHPSPTTYTIHVDGHLDDHRSAWLGDLDLTRDPDGTTTVTVAVADQAQLHGILAGLRDIGAVLLELRVSDAQSPVCRPAQERPLRTRRLTLRPATTDDTEPPWRFRRLEEVNEWLTGSPADLEGYRALFCEPARLATTLVVSLGDATGPVIGDLMLRRGDAWGQREVAERAHDVEAELGWVLDPAHTGHGYATEAVRELLRCCFEDLGLRRVTAHAFLDNEPSWRLMERVGMRREVHGVRDSLHRSGRWLDSVGYAILRDEWSAGGPPRSG